MTDLTAPYWIVRWRTNLGGLVSVDHASEEDAIRDYCTPDKGWTYQHCLMVSRRTDGDWQGDPVNLPWLAKGWVDPLLTTGLSEWENEKRYGVRR